MTEAVVPLKQQRDSEPPRQRTAEGEVNQACKLHYGGGQLQSESRSILHTTRRTIKYNLAAEVGELTHRHKAHRETGNM